MIDGKGLIVQPIQVYLDSSDFSDITNIKKKSSEYSDVLNYLLKKRDEGLIQIRFSEAHVVEAAPTTTDSIPAAIERLKIIQEICGKNSLIHPIDLIAYEVSSNAIPGSNDGRSHIFRSDANWLPALFEFSEIIPDAEKSLQQDIEKMGRPERRKYLKNGRPTPLWYGEMREANNATGSMIANDLPLTTDAIRIFRKYFIGDASRKEALKALRDSITDLEVFGNWYKKDWGRASDISRHLRDIGAEFETALDDARRQFELMILEQTEAGADSKKLLDLSVRAFHEVLANSSSRLVNKLALQIGATPKLSEDIWQTSPGLTCSVTLAMHIARRSVAAKLPRSPKSSDFPDCYHAIYLPYVDVFRADGFIAGMLRECKIPLSTVIVDKFLQLPVKIDELLEARKVQ
ncbi:hypothetical protein O3297_07565 [Janthinobacterium sp. SUN128]|uniref:hypothetical protein n=1 Tax=Janthinobacterium sp. SUN128 TaxID=3014790 RepID=UPI00271297CE|nr:hypothetical protein [Janthinobacterium sp. SUN128]MDO8033268.1 hypothetical protein [Janthinobacterium sp. SUN128]